MAVTRDVDPDRCLQQHRQSTGAVVLSIRTRPDDNDISMYIYIYIIIYNYVYTYIERERKRERDQLGEQSRLRDARQSAGENKAKALNGTNPKHVIDR